MEQIYEKITGFKVYKNNLIKYKNTIDTICLVNLVVYFSHLFMTTTMFRYDTELIPFSKICVAIATLITLYRCASLRRNDRSDACIIFILLVIGVANLIIRHDRSFLACVLMIISVRGLSFRRIVSCLITAGALIMLAAILASQMGLIENLVYNSRKGRHAYALGIIYSTDFAAHVFFLFLGYAYIKKGKFRIYEYIGIAVLTVIMFEFTRARNNTICILLFLTATAVYNFILLHVNGRIAEYVNRTIVVLSVAFIISCVVGSLAITIIYPKDNALFKALAGSLQARYRMGNQAFCKYGITLFGSDIPQIGFGITSIAPEWYFFLDISYVKILFCKGVVVFAAILIMEVRCIAKCIKKNIYLLMIFAIIALECSVEHHLDELAYNFFLLAVFAELSDDSRQAAS